MPGRRRREPRGGVLVIHENRGLTDSIRAIAGRLAGERLLRSGDRPVSEEGGTGSFEDEFEAMAALGAAPDVAPRRRPEGGRDGAPPTAAGEEGGRDRVLFRRRDDLATAGREGVTPGGGGAVLRAVPRGRQPRRLKAAVLGIYAELDSRVNASRDGRACGASEGEASAPDRHLPGRRPRVLQSDRLTARPGCCGCRLPADAGLVRHARREHALAPERLDEVVLEDRRDVVDHVGGRHRCQRLHLHDVTRQREPDDL